MKLQSNERGELNVLLIPVILLSILFVGAGAFAVWAYGGRQDFKNNVDAKISSAVAANKTVVENADAAQFAQAAKLPLKTYAGPEDFGSVKLSYPKTWSGYVITGTVGAGTPIDAYFDQDVVPDTGNQASVYALRVQVIAQSYSQVVASYSGLLQRKVITIQPYSFPKVSSVTGVRIDGQLTQTKQGSMIIVPVRDKTLKIWTESNTFLGDFNNNILPNISFSP